MKYLKRFNIISESLLNNYSLTKDQEYKYMLHVRNILRKKYPIYVKTIKGGKINRLIDDDLNWVSGNKLIRNEIIKDYNISTYEELMNVIEKNKEKIFVNDIDRYLKIFKKTKEIGKGNELYAMSEIYKMLGGQQSEFDILRPSKEEDDYIEGIDIEIKSKKDPNIYITCQVKPAIKSYSEGLYFKIESLGDVKRYDTDLICFTSEKGIALFLLNDYKVEDKYYLLKRENYIKDVEQFYSKLKIIHDK